MSESLNTMSLTTSCKQQAFKIFAELETEYDFESAKLKLTPELAQLADVKNEEPNAEKVASIGLEDCPDGTANAAALSLPNCCPALEAAGGSNTAAEDLELLRPNAMWPLVEEDKEPNAEKVANIGLEDCPDGTANAAALSLPNCCPAVQFDIWRDEDGAL